MRYDSEYRIQRYVNFGFRMPRIYGMWNTKSNTVESKRQAMHSVYVLPRNQPRPQRVRVSQEKHALGKKGGNVNSRLSVLRVPNPTHVLQPKDETSAGWNLSDIHER